MIRDRLNRDFKIKQFDTQLEEREWQNHINRSDVEVHFKDIFGNMIADKVEIKIYNTQLQSLKNSFNVTFKGDQGGPATLEVPAFPTGQAKIDKDVQTAWETLKPPPTAQRDMPPKTLAYGWNKQYLLMCSHDCEVLEAWLKNSRYPSAKRSNSH